MTLSLDLGRGGSSAAKSFDAKFDQETSFGRFLDPQVLEDLAPCARLKIDELMFQFWSNEAHHQHISRLLDDFEAGFEVPETFMMPGSGLSSPVLSPRRSFGGQRQPGCSPPRSPRSPSSPGSFPSSPRSGNGGSPFSHRKSLSNVHMPAIGSSAINITPVKESTRLKKEADGEMEEKEKLPTFYEPDRKFEMKDLAPEFVAEVERHFEDSVRKKILVNDFVSMCKDVCNFPTFFNECLCRRIKDVYGAAHQGEVEEDEEVKEEEMKEGESKADVAKKELYITQDEFFHFWLTEMEPYDELDRFFRLVKKKDATTISGADFMPYLEELLAYHPGLEFLEATPEFQEKYARTVVARVLYEVNVSRSGQITRRELRRSDLLEACHQVDEEEDINLVFRYFNYEGFYVCYVKFWELDTDHDFLLSKEDLMRHGGHALVPRIVERIFEQPVYPFMSNDPAGRMGYEDFIFFFLAEEDKTNPVSLRYWFHCVDLDGDGVICPWEMRFFYEEQLQRLRSYGHEAISFPDVLCQANDFVNPNTEGKLVYSDFCKPEVINISGMMFNILFNLNKFIAFEQRDPHWIRAQQENPDLTEWDRFVAIEYARLASAEEEREIEEDNLANWHRAQGNDGLDSNESLTFTCNESPF